ncbi:hypothetical protein ACFSKS_13985 [Pseudocitrobacter faecalis]
MSDLFTYCADYSVIAGGLFDAAELICRSVCFFIAMEARHGWFYARNFLILGVRWMTNMTR